MDILLERFSIPQSSLNAAVAEKTLNLFQWHTALKGKGSSSMPKNMRGDMASDTATGEDLADLILNGLDGKTVVRSPTSDKKGGIKVAAGRQISAEGNFSLRI